MIEELMFLRTLAPEGQYVLPANIDERTNILVVGDVYKSTHRNWFAMILEDHDQYVEALVEIINSQIISTSDN